MGFPVPCLDVEYELALIRSPSVIPAIDPDPNLGLSENRGYPQISNFNGEHGDNPLEYEIHYFQTNPFRLPDVNLPLFCQLKSCLGTSC